MIKLKNISLMLLALGLTCSSVVAQENTTVKENVTAKEKNGAIKFASEDGQYKWAFGGRTYMDAVYYMDDATDLSSRTNISDVRLYGVATWGQWDAKINFNFAKNKISAKDVYLNYRFNKNTSVKFGNFFEPFGIQGSISSKNTRFIGSSNSGQAFGISRSIGIAATNYTDMYFISAGVFAGRMNNPKMGDGGFSVTGKAVYTPINEEGMLFHIGASASYRLPDANGFDSKYNDDDYNREVKYAAGPEHKFLNAHVGNAGTEVKFNAEILATYGSFLLQGEYYMNKVNRRDNYDLQFEHSEPSFGWKQSKAEDLRDWYGEQRDIKTKGYYAQLGFLIGDEYSYNSASAYLNRPKAGSIEILARMNNTNLNDIDGIFMQDKFWNAGLNANGSDKRSAGQPNHSVGGGESTDYSVALNYYINNNVMFKLNYTMMDIDNVYYRMDDKISYLQARLQLNF